MSAIKNAEPQITLDESPAIESVSVVDGQHRVLAVSWSRGRRKDRTDVVSLSPLIDTHKFYAPLRRNSELFETVRVIDDGFALAWVNGSIDMSAASVERLAEEAMTGKDFCDFMKRNALTHQAAAAALGRSKRQIENYVQYDVLPRMVVLACIGYETRKIRECTGAIWKHAVDGVSPLSLLTVGDGKTVRWTQDFCVHYDAGMWPNQWNLPISIGAITVKQSKHGG